MDGALTFIHICVDSSQTVLEHHRSIIRSTLVSQLKEKKQGLNPRPPVLATSALITELRLPSLCIKVLHADIKLNQVKIQSYMYNTHKFDIPINSHH